MATLVVATNSRRVGVPLPIFTTRSVEHFVSFTHELEGIWERGEKEEEERRERGREEGRTGGGTGRELVSEGIDVDGCLAERDSGSCSYVSSALSMPRCWLIARGP